MKRITVLLIVALITSTAVLAGQGAATRVGNGDDGGDLEGFKKIESGKILKTRNQALKLLKKLNTAGIRGLGQLQPELKNSSLFMGKKQVSKKLSEDSGSFHSNMRGKVYARTFATPNSPTRFFPVALKLDRDQLIALHIHEALHRSLPEEIRENESIVSEITLAMTAPDATHDQVRKTVKKHLPDDYADSIRTSKSAAAQADIKEDVREYFEQPSSLGYGYRLYQTSDQPMNHPVEQLHYIHSYLYPFGKGRNAFGLGVEFGFFDGPSGFNTGPLSFSARLRLWTVRDFDFGLWGKASLNTLSNEELTNSAFGRDTFTLGLSVEKTTRMFFVRTTMGYTFSGDASRTFGTSTIRYDYGEIFEAGIHGGLAIWKFRIGGYAEIDLSNGFRITQEPNYVFDPGRYRIVSGGPSIRFIEKDFSVELSGRFLLDSSKGASFDMLGDIMGQGAAQGNVEGKINVHF